MGYDSVKLTGRLTISLNGKIVREVDNKVVTVGKEWIASRMQGGADSVMTHMEIGTGTTAVAAGDTALETPAVAARVALTTSGGTAATNTITFDAVFPADVPDVTAPATAPITEAGLFNNSVGGTMAARTVFAAINKGETDIMSVTWVITIP